MDFSHSEEFDEIRRTVREFAENEIRPHMMEWDEAQTFPRDVLDRLGKLGLLGILIPSEYGGANLGYQEYVAIVEELSRVDGSIGISVAAHNSLCTGHIYLAGTEETLFQRHILSNLERWESMGLQILILQKAFLK